MAKLLADENVPLRLLNGLIRLGHDILRIQDMPGVTAGMPDPDILRLAISLQRGILTENAWDFVRLHRQDPDHAGIVTFTRDADVTALADRVHEHITREGDLAGKLIRVRRPST